MQLTTADVTAANDSEKLAILECMLLAVFADGQVSVDERRQFDAIVGALDWGMDRPVLIALLQGAQSG